MANITLYKIDCFESNDEKEIGIFYSLLPWNEEPGRSFDDDGGREYVLPNGYELDSVDGDPRITGESGICSIQEYNGLPVLIDPVRKQAILLERVKKIQQVREAAGMTRAELAQLLEISQKELFELENCEREAGTRLLSQIARHLSCDIMDLI